MILSAHVSLGSWPIFAYGTEEQKKKYLVPLAKGEKIGAFGLTEPNAGSDAGGTETTALDKGDYYLLNGGKIFITNAPKADTYVVDVYKRQMWKWRKSLPRARSRCGSAATAGIS